MDEVRQKAMNTIAEPNFFVLFSCPLVAKPEDLITANVSLMGNPTSEVLVHFFSSFAQISPENANLLMTVGLDAYKRHEQQQSIVIPTNAGKIIV